MHNAVSRGRVIQLPRRGWDSFRGDSTGTGAGGLTVMIAVMLRQELHVAVDATAAHRRNGASQKAFRRCVSACGSSKITFIIIRRDRHDHQAYEQRAERLLRLPCSFLDDHRRKNTDPPSSRF